MSSSKRLDMIRNLNKTENKIIGGAAYEEYSDK